MYFAKSRLYLAAAAALTSASIVCSSCEQVPTDFDEHVESSESDLWSAGGASVFWPSATIPVCFTILQLNPALTNADPDTDFLVVNGNTDGVTWMNAVRSLIETNYETIPNAAIDFTGWGYCPTNMPGSQYNQLRIILDVTSSTSNAAPNYTPGAYMRRCSSSNTVLHGNSCGGGGTTTTRETIIQIARLYWDTWMHPVSNAAVLHEIGHALGMDHEFVRSDYTATCYGAEGGETGGLRITPFDPGSIMSATYCGGAFVLSEIDKVGFSVAYPSGMVLTPRLATSFIMGDGTFLTLSGTTISHRWIDGGVYPAAYGSNPNWSVRGLFETQISAASIKTSLSTPVSIGSYHTNSTVFVDFAGRQYQVPSVNFHVDDSLFSSLVTIVTM